MIVKSYKDATINIMRYHVQLSLKRKPDQVILQFGTNNMKTKGTAQEIANQLIDLAEDISTHTNKVVISSILPRGDEYNEKVEEVNYLLELYCEQENTAVLRQKALTQNFSIFYFFLDLYTEFTCASSGEGFEFVWMLLLLYSRH